MAVEYAPLNAGSPMLPDFNKAMDDMRDAIMRSLAVPPELLHPNGWMLRDADFVALLRSVRDDPFAAWYGGARLLLADWCEENGRAADADAVRRAAPTGHRGYVMNSVPNSWWHSVHFTSSAGAVQTIHFRGQLSDGSGPFHESHLLVGGNALMHFPAPRPLAGEIEVELCGPAGASAAVTLGVYGGGIMGPSAVLSLSLISDTQAQENCRKFLLDCFPPLT